MAGKDMIMATHRELKQLHIVQKVIEGTVKQVEAAELLSLSDRQIRRILKRIREEGAAGVVHRLRGKPSNRQMPEEIKSKVIALYREKYQGFGPTLASEKLLDADELSISDETLRKWLIESGDWQKRRKRTAHRQWRERKSSLGEMLQLDGSHHDWFEGRRPKCVLMAYIDDATSKVYGRFYEYEGTIPAMDSFKRYIRKHGIPMSVYMDKHTTYKSTAEPSIEDEINGTMPLSEFGRALTELAVEIIHAHSPQAKGRIERLFKTLQDRLVKEMTIRGIDTIDEANRYLDTYLSAHNKRFAVKAKAQDDLHREIPRGLNLDKVLCIKTVRTLRNDFTVAHDGKLYQVVDAVRTKKVVVEERINGTMEILYEDRPLKFREILARPQKQQPPVRPSLPKRTPVAPPRNHPWRQYKTLLPDTQKRPAEVIP